MIPRDERQRVMIRLETYERIVSQKVLRYICDVNDCDDYLIL